MADAVSSPLVLPPDQYPRFQSDDPTMSQWPADWWSKFDINKSPELAGPFGNMLFQMSQGRVGSPYTPPPTDPYAQSRQAQAQYNAWRGSQQPSGTVSGPGGGLMSGYNSNPVLGRAFPQLFGNQYQTNPLSPQTNQPFALTRTPKNPAIDAGLAANLANPNGPQRDQSLSQFVKDFIANRPNQTAALGQESNFIGSTYDPNDPNGLQSQLAGVQSNRSALLRKSAQDAIRTAGRDNNIARMGQGNSSYLDRAYNDRLGQILTQQAVSDTDLARQNVMDVQNARTGLLGQRQNLSNNYNQAGLMPVTAIDQARMGDLQNLYYGGLVDNSNSVYRDNTFNNNQSTGSSLIPSAGLRRPRGIGAPPLRRTRSPLVIA